MRRILFAAAAVMAAAAFAVVSIGSTKSTWIKCGVQEINLDASKKTYLLVWNGTEYDGPAKFNPGEIYFEYVWFPTSYGGGIKGAYSIDRKSLKYIETTFTYIRVFGETSNKKGWSMQESSPGYPNPKIGICSIMKTPPITGNQI